MSEAVSATVKIVNLRGLHARASAKFCAVTNSFDANVRVTHEDWTVPGNSIMGLATLGAGIGSEIVISAEGPQAAEAVDTLVKLVTDKFGEKE
ncbi:MAG: HPr family phosphocarrier protein [Amphiplicatus sp.]|nr:HPr family phosphocarrier protein [Amphiplicatus sp.]MCB9954311.1 HPr family phosphocarrier protein [Caulobacterales bacterium]